ncbi:MAG: cadmium carbonic anhydrase [Thiobacillus sp. SCN 63-1177]|nr:MAG: cadmium carbonic anhydrase [Thiobacillus sp. SCN 63-1177]
MAISGTGAAEGLHAEAKGGEICEGFGPQTPRDIDVRKGENKRVFTMAPDYKQMNLCNIHLHKNAEHKGRAFSLYAGEGDGHGYESGYQCNISKVHSSCDVKPGNGLGSCLSASCANPALRVETQVFTLVNDPKALDFMSLDYKGRTVKGYHQANAIPSNTGKPVTFLGSTTGPKYSDQTCSPLQVTWSVRPNCAKVDISSVGKWCEQNAFGEDHAHGVRKLVTNPRLLSTIK